MKCFTDITALIETRLKIFNSLCRLASPKTESFQETVSSKMHRENIHLLQVGKRTKYLGTQSKNGVICRCYLGIVLTLHFSER